MNLQTIVLGGGCFWCTEGIFQRVPGVSKVVSGYAGGSKENPTYEEVSSGSTGHAEVISVEFDSDVVKLSRILELFFLLHDPTTLNRQGADIGTQYRSAVYFTEPTQESVVKEAIELASKEYENPIVTEVKVLDKFYKAEDYHQDFYNQNQGNPYCQLVINPKLSKLMKALGK